MILLLVVSAALALSAGACSQAPSTSGPPPPRTSVRAEIGRLLEAGPGSLGVADTAGADSTWRQVLAFYQARRGEPAWSGRAPYPRADRLVTALEAAPGAGLDPADYDVAELRRLLQPAPREGPPDAAARHRRLARLDVRATYAWLRMAAHLGEGRVPRVQLDPDWKRPAGSGSWQALLERTLADDPVRTFAALEPRHEGYRRLREALAHYRAIAASGGWDTIPPGPALSRGARGPRVAALVRRLAASGDLAGPVRDTVFDRRLVAAVGDLQSRLGIPRSGIVGGATRAALNVPVEARIHAMELNLERWRWLPDDLGERHVAVNIPAYRLELVRQGRVTRTMRVVVGKKKSPTPVFSDALTYLEVNPTWTLPPSVVVKELVPDLKRNPEYLAQNQMHVVSIADANRDTVDWREVPWEQAGTDSFLYLVVQAAGPENPLGRVKLMCPNEYDVYLHDSPVRSRFSVAVRDYSHGCVRVEEAVELADSLVVATPTDTVGIDSLIARGEWQRVRLPAPVPVHFLYWTAWADTAGKLNFRDDLYGLDERLDQALRTRTTAQLAVNPGVAVSPFWLAAEIKAQQEAARVAEARAKRAAARSATANAVEPR